MKQFNLEEYLKNPSKEVITRNGKDVRIVCTDAKGEYYPILALVDKGDYESPVCYTKNGECCLGQEKNYDLFFAPKKHEGWINLYNGVDKTFTCIGYVYNSKEEAKNNISKNSLYLKTIKIEWEE